MSAEGQIKSFIDRVLRLKEEQDELSRDIRDVYAEAKGMGFDKTAMGEVVAYLRKIEKSGKDAVAERGAMFDMYLNAYERPSHVHAREDGEVNAKLIATVAAGMQTEIGRKALVTALDIMIDREEQEASDGASPAVRQLAGSARDEESAASYSEMDRATEGSFETGSEAAEKGRKAIPAGPEGADLNHAGAGESPATISEKATVAAQGEATAPTSDERVSPDEGGSAAANTGGDHVTSIASRERDMDPTSNIGEGAACALPAKSILRPLCRNPGETCGGYGRKHCRACELAAAELEAAE